MAAARAIVTISSTPSLSLKRLHLKNCDFTGQVFVELTRNSQLAELQCLELAEIEFTHEELTTILDNCPRLETLNMRSCYSIQLNDDKALRAKCDRIKNLTISDCYTDTGYDYHYHNFHDADYDYYSHYLNIHGTDYMTMVLTIHIIGSH